MSNMTEALKVDQGMVLINPINPEGVKEHLRHGQEIKKKDLQVCVCPVFHVTGKDQDRKVKLTHL